METIDSYGKGAVKDQSDSRDYVAEAVMGVPILDFSQEFRLPPPPNEDQGRSLSCVSQAWSYYHWQLNRKDYSRRDLYSRIFLPDGGAYIRDGGRQIVNKGHATRDEAPDPSPQTEQAMRDGSGITDEERLSDLEAGYFLITQNTIDAIALALREYNGVVFGVKGSNQGWQDMANPRPPLPGEEMWGHAIYAMGYHLHNGQKCIIAKSSWCNSGVTEHHIKEDYFISNNTFNAWTLIPKEAQPMTNSIIVKRKVNALNGTMAWEYGIYDPDTTGDGLISSLRNRGIKPPLKPDGTIDFAVLDGMVRGTIVEV